MDAMFTSSAQIKKVCFRQYQWWRLVLVGSMLFYMAIGCQSLDQAVEVQVSENSTYERVINHQVELKLAVGDELKKLIETGAALGIEIRSAESGLLERRDWIDYVLLNESTLSDGSFSRQVIGPLMPIKLSEGVYQIHLFFKENEQNLSDHSDTPQPILCPSPLNLRNPLTLTNFDLADVSWVGRIDRDQILELSFKQQTCGIGDRSTALKGRLTLPPEVSDIAQKRLMIHFSPLPLTEEPPLTIPLSRYMYRDEDSEDLSFFINQVPSGSYKITVFIDSDGDTLPTPCDRSIGMGGDQWISSSLTIDVERAEIFTLVDTIILESVESCDTLLTELRTDELDNSEKLASIYLGQIELDHILNTAIRFSPDQKVWFSSQRRQLPPYRFVEGIELFTLQEAIIADGRFSVHLDSDISESQTEFAIWVDEGRDRTLSPCDDLSDLGSDLWWWVGNKTQFTQLLNIDIESPPPLEKVTISRRCDAPESIVNMTINFNFIWPELSSVRPLVLVYEDILSGQIYESLLKDINVDQIEQPLTLRRRLKPGAYLLSAYIDQDLDLQFTPCTAYRLGDRLSSSRATIVSVSAQETESVTLSITPRECPESRASPEIRLISPLTNLPLAEDEIVHNGLDECEEDQFLITLTDPNILGNSSEESILISTCAPLSSEGLTLQALPAGFYHVETCIPIADELRSELIGDTCSSPSYWRGFQEFTLTEVPVQRVDLNLTASCTCDLSLP